MFVLNLVCRPSHQFSKFFTFSLRLAGLDSTTDNIKELSNILEKNQFSSRIMNIIVKQYLNKFFASTSRAFTVTSPDETHTHYYKLPFVGPFSSIAQRRIRRFTQRFCKNLDIKLVFAPYKIKNLFSVKDAIPKTLRSRVV